MKATIAVLILLAVAGYFVYSYAKSSADSFDPTEQGREARAAVEECTSWTEVLDRVGTPPKWRDSTSDFDFTYTERFDDTTREFITGKLAENAYAYGFSFFYRFTDAVTFAVNFDRYGKLSNIQDKEGKGALMDAAGG